MESNRWAIRRSLLVFGVLVGPFYLTVGLVQAFVRRGSTSGDTH